MHRLLSLVAFLALAACSAPDAGAPGAFLVEEVPTPTAEGSGEPYLSSGEDAVFLSWIEGVGAEGHAVRVAGLSPSGWGTAHTVAQDTDFFVNWADFPSVAVDTQGRLWAHWLQREEGPGLAYAIRLAHSSDGGATWSEPWTPHEDGTPTEHGFVSVFPWGEGVGLTWLDGRQYAPGPAGEAPTREMTVRFREAGGAVGPGPEVLLDPRACDCCQTDVAVTGDGPVLVYRDRSPDEVRDIYVARWTPEGWTEGRPVHDDGWVIGGCPVNGPAIDARDAWVVVAWFTAAGDVAKVQAAFSSDGGRTFGAPYRIDDGNPAGRVDVRLREDGSALVTWLERTQGDAAELRIARVQQEVGVGPVGVVSGSSAARASGFARMARLPWDPRSVLVAWTDVSDPERSQIRLARVELP